MNKYPENRLNIRVDKNGKISFEQDPAFAAVYFAMAAHPAAERLQELQEELEDLENEEPENLYGDEHDEWEQRRAELEDEISDLEDEIS